MGRKHRHKKKKNDDMKKKVDVVFRILALEVFLKRLPLKSDIGRCRCVCREWNSFLSTPEFTRMHLQKYQVTIDDCRLLLVDEENEPSFPFRTLSFNQTLPPFKLNPYRKPDVLIIASLDGLVCLAVSVEGEVDPTATQVFLNPMTGVCKKLPPIPELTAFDPMGFYFDSCDNDYKLVCLVRDGLHGALVYSNRLDSWREIEFSVLPPSKLWPYCWSLATFYAQCLYFQVTCFDDVSRIVCFDVKTETFREIPVPPPTYANGVTDDGYSVGLVVLNGCLRLYVTYKISDVEDGVDVWRMKDDDEWEKVDAFTRRQAKEQEQLICTETTDNWLAILDQRGNSFKKMSMEDFTTRYPCFSSAPRNYTATRLIYVQTLLNP